MNFLYHFRGGDDLLIVHVPAFLRRDLVFYVNGCNSGELVVLHRADHVQRITIAGIRVSNDRYVHGLRDAPRVIHHLRHRQQTDIRPPEQRCRSAKSRHVDRGEAGLFDEPRAERVIGAGRQNGFAAAQQFGEPRPPLPLASQKIVHGSKPYAEVVC